MFFIYGLLIVFSFMLGFVIGWISYWQRIRIDKLKKKTIKNKKINPQ